MTKPVSLACAFLVLLAAKGYSAELPEKVSFNRDIRPILSNNCFHCHGPDEKHREANLRLDDAQAAVADREGTPAIVPGDPGKSEVWKRITSKDEFLRMPPEDSNKNLTAEQVALIKRWIEQGAEYQGHWSFIPPTRPAVPKVQLQTRVRNPIDAFIQARLEEERLRPSPEASKEALIRRVTFDLTGLPPTLAEIDAFLQDNSPNAYEKVVDRLLRSPHYGERMTLAWLDAARYGDTSVYHADGPRDMWAWRDRVIDSYNRNVPFDQFTTEQLAGDLIPDGSVQQKIASAFNRNHGTTDEGGAIAEEYRVEYVVDRVKTTATVWMGLTMECGQCHEHKYDPISQEEYYQFFAFFNQTKDRGMQTRKGNAAPLVEVPKAGSQQKVKELNRQIAQIDAQIEAHQQAVEPQFVAWSREAAANADKAQTLPGNMLAYFPLDEAEGAHVVGSVDPNRKGNIKGKPLWDSGKHGAALKCDGSNYVDLGDVGNFERTDAFSYGGWIFPEANGAPIARMDDGNRHRGYDLYLAGNKISVHLIHTWPNDAIKVTTKASFKPKKWQHIFVTYDGSSKASGVKIYVNGKEQEWNIEQDRLKSSIRTDKPLYLGRRNPGSPYKGKIDDVRIYNRSLTSAEVAALAGQDPIAPILATPEEKRSPEQVAVLRNHYLQNHDAQYRKLQGEKGKLQKEVAEWSKPLTTVMTMEEMGKPRLTYLLQRGHYASPDKSKVIEPGVPEIFPPLPKEAPQNRLGLAQWLTSRNHPLTARVAVNRYWQMLFGTGIVSTPQDFGSQGAWPTHPALLDWLAVDFMESGWDVKRMLKQMVMSSTYRQTSKVTPELLKKDPNNTLLARGPRFRLQGEFIRDNALAVSGLLVKQIGGPSVKPYQPPGLWNEVSLSGNVRFKQDHGEKLYRRSMYIYWKRSAPPPSMRLFDAPTREKCVVQRQRTNTPLQALVTLNDPQFVEAARFLAERMIKEGGQTPESRIRFAYRLATAKLPKEQVTAVLQNVFEAQLAKYQENAEQAQKLLSAGEGKRDESIAAAEHAAWTVVASMILNLDETLTRG